jgi:hypothetical protein
MILKALFPTHIYSTPFYAYAVVSARKFSMQPYLGPFSFATVARIRSPHAILPRAKYVTHHFGELRVRTLASVPPLTVAFFFSAQLQSEKAGCERLEDSEAKP